MRKLTIEEMEELEDIEITLDKEIIETKNKYNDFYIQTKIGKIIINKKDDSNKYIIDVCRNGFIIENPNIRKFYENKEFTKDELITFINDFDSNYKKILFESRIYENQFKLLSENNLILKGINFEPISDFKEINKYEYRKYKKLNTIIYLEDLKGIKYRLNFFEKESLDMYRENPAQWGYVNFEIIYNYPKEFLFTPKYLIDTNVSQDEIQDNFNKDENLELKLLIKSDEGQLKEIGKIYYRYNNGNILCPNGFVKDTLNLTNFNTEKNKYFTYDSEILKKLLKLEERIPY